MWAFTEHEHLDLVRGINRIHEIACQAGNLPRAELSVDLLDVLHWVDGTLEPHIAWEETWLYPEIDARTDSPWATRAARFDHRQIRGIADRDPGRPGRAQQLASSASTTPRPAAICSAWSRSCAPISSARSAS